MNDDETIPSSNPPPHQPWNKGKLIGAKPPLRASNVWSIRTRLQLEGRSRDLALFNLAIDSKLRGCDVVAVRVDDVAPNGYTLDRATVRQKKTGRAVRFELTEQTRRAIDEYLRLTRRKPGYERSGGAHQHRGNGCARWRLRAGAFVPTKALLGSAQAGSGEPACAGTAGQSATKLAPD
jgi:hypothetical protein